MPGVNLFESLTLASRKMKRCCVKTLNDEIGQRPKAEHVKAETHGGGPVTIVVDCPICRSKTQIKATPGAADVQTVAAC